MKSVPILTQLVPCFGIGCPSHLTCPQYEAINGSDPAAPRIGTCVGLEGGPLFVERAPELRAEVSA